MHINSIIFFAFFFVVKGWAQTSLWVMTQMGGISNNGVIFTTDSAGNNYTVQHNFTTHEGYNPQNTTLIQATNGKLYGLTNKGSIYDKDFLFEYDPTTSSYNKKFNFDGQTNVVSQYKIYRDSLSVGNWKLIGTTAGTQTGWTDVNYASYLNARYRFVVTFGYECTPTKSLNTLKVRSTSNQSGNSIINVGLMELKDNNTFTVYPNPSNGEFTINLKGKVQNTKLSIVDMLGKEAFTSVITTQNSSFNIQHLSKGVYFVKVDNTVKKLVVE